MRKNSVICLVKSESQADEIVGRLKSSGFSPDDISVLFPDRSGTKDFAHEHNTKAPEGATAGAGVGGALGGTLGWLVGAGALAIPGLGPFVAAGPLMAALAGLGVGGAVGGLVGALAGMGIPEYEAKRYDGRVRQGGILVSVHCDSPEGIARAKDILKQTGAEDVASAGEAGSDYGKTDKPLSRHPSPRSRTTRNSL